MTDPSQLRRSWTTLAGDARFRQEDDTTAITEPADPVTQVDVRPANAAPFLNTVVFLPGTIAAIVGGITAFLEVRRGRPICMRSSLPAEGPSPSSASRWGRRQGSQLRIRLFITHAPQLPAGVLRTPALR